MLRPLAALFAALVVLGAPVRARAQAQPEGGCVRGAPELRSLEFEGNDALGDDDLLASIVSRASSRARRILGFFGERRCLVRDDIPRDQARLILRYRRAGFPRVVVTPRLAVRGDRARLRFEITEGPPLLTDSVVVTGPLPDSVRRRLARRLPLLPGAPLDGVRMDSARGVVARRLRDRGYLQASVSARQVVDSGAGHGWAALDAEPGPRVRAGEIRVQAVGRDGGEPRVSEQEALELTGLREGQVLRERDLEQARRNLYVTDVHGTVSVRADSIRTLPDGGAVADVAVTLIEDDPNELRARAGWGTLDCTRFQVELDRTAVFQPAGHATLTARASKIGIGDPLDFAPGTCASEARDDPYSARLNYYAGASYRHPPIGAAGIERSVTLYSERRSEFLAFLRTTYMGGVVSVVKPWQSGWRLSLGYDLSYGRTEAQPAIQCVVFAACLPEDRDVLSAARRFAVVSAAMQLDRTNSALDPTRGYLLRFEARGAQRGIFSNSREEFGGARVEASAYRRLTTNLTLATRIRTGAVTAIGGGYVPQQERLFAGGASTVRGFRQNEIGPRVYLPGDVVQIVVVNGDTLFRAQPGGGERVTATGGNSMVVGNVELRARPPVLRDLLQVVAFVDAGSVWDRGASGAARGFKLRATPGIGMRAFTPVGPVRVDIGYNPYVPAPGPAYWDAPGQFLVGENVITAGSAPLYCVSPDNALPVTGFDQMTGDGRFIWPVQAAGPCPASYAPPRPSGFLQRLTVHFSLGQAF